MSWFVVKNSSRSSRLTISVVVCTYNRADLLVGVLQTLCEQDFDSSQYEIIVVDNNSTDDTRNVSEDFCRHYPNVRYVSEIRQGLSHARNRGWQEAQGDYVGYVDDDCRVPKHWLGIASEIIDQKYPGAFGGPAFPFYNTARPRWYKDSYGSHEPHKEARMLSKDECTDIFGFNMVFRRALLQTSGGFDPRLGMTGKKIAYGEETALLQMIAAITPPQIIYYDPRLYVYHLVQSKKMTVRWILQSSFARGRYGYRLSEGNAPSQVGKRQLLRRAIKTSIFLAVDLAGSAFYRDRVRHPYVRNYLAEFTCGQIARLGKLYEQYCQISERSTSGADSRQQTDL